MKMLKEIFVLVLLIMVSSSQAFQQTAKTFLTNKDSSGQILPALSREIHGRLGNQFEVSFLRFNSILGANPIVDIQGPITDPYGTLAGLVLFSANPEDYDPEDFDSTAIGFFKDGKILWCSGPILKGSPSQIFCAGDLTGQGQVDLVILWLPANGSHGGVNDIFVLSWNGKSGQIICDTSQGESNLVTSGSMIRVSKNNKGVFDIQAYWPNDEDLRAYYPDDKIRTRPWVTYRWDGSKFKLMKKGTP
jgi:hypothetical protein